MDHCSANGEATGPRLIHWDQYPTGVTILPTQNMHTFFLGKSNITGVINITNPTQNMHYLKGKIPQNDHAFAIVQFFSQNGELNDPFQNF